ncbi:MAG: fumarate hydratase [Candidatus Bathyarchaeia archaeon]
MIDAKKIEDLTVDLLRLAVIELPKDVKEALERAKEKETSDIAKANLNAILENIRLAESMKRPVCQDTGLIVFFLDVGHDFGSVKGIPEAIVKGTKRATEEIPLRPNAVHPISRKNSGDNTGSYVPILNWNYVEGDYLEITAFPKGGGSENMTFFSMVKPGEGIVGIKKFVIDSVISSGGQPCPPTIIGVGIGGTADLALKLAKKSLLRPIGQRHSDPEIAKLEEELLKAINSTGIGPMGLGGNVTSLDVHADYAHCHTASLPVAVNTQCWAARRATARVYRDGRVEILSHRR